MDGVTLERILNSPSTLHRVKKLPPSRPINGDYLERNTVVPLDSYGNGRHTYRLSISPPDRNGLLTVTLREYDNEERLTSSKLSAQAPAPKLFSTYWVDSIADKMLRAARDTGILHQEFPDYGALRGLMAAGIEFYLRGGSAQRRDN